MISIDVMGGLLFAGMVACATAVNSYTQFRALRQSERNHALAQSIKADGEALKGDVQVVRLTVNGRLDQLLAATKALARAEGHTEGEAYGRSQSVVDPAVTALAAEKVLAVAEAKILSQQPVQAVTPAEH